MLRHRLATLSAALAVASLGATTLPRGAGAQAQQRPTFRSAAELVVVDATAVGRDGTPVADLRPADFKVTFNGRRREVVSADFVRLGSPSATRASGDNRAAAAHEGRLVVIAVDEHSVPAGAQAAAREAVSRILDRAETTDAVALVTFPGAVAVGPTLDHARVKAAINRVDGRRVDAPKVRFNLSASEAIALRSREPVSTGEIVSRECQREFTNPACSQEVREAAAWIADTLEQQGLLTIDALHGVLDNLQGVPGRKLLFVVSAGLPTTNAPGGRPNLTGATEAVARRAAAANIQLYVFYLNVQFLQHFSVATGWRSPSSLYQDINLFGSGLQRFADSAGGAFFQVEVDSDPFVDRAFRETSASYRLAVRPDPSNADGKPRQIRVTVTRSGVTLRYRRMVTIPRR